MLSGQLNRISADQFITDLKNWSYSRVVRCNPINPAMPGRTPSAFNSGTIFRHNSALVVSQFHQLELQPVAVAFGQLCRDAPSADD